MIPLFVLMEGPGKYAELANVKNTGYGNTAKGGGWNEYD